MRGRERRRRVILLACMLIGGLVAVPVASVVYKYSIGFYSFKRTVARKLLPNWPPPPQRLELPALQEAALTTAGDLVLLSEWSPEVVTDEYSSERSRLRIQPSPGREVDLFVHPLAGFIDLTFSRGGVLFKLARTAWGDWDTFTQEYSSDRETLESIVDKELPHYLERSSPAMRRPIGFYALPFFPAPKNYRKEYGRLAAKVLLSDYLDPTLKASGDHLYFVVVPRDTMLGGRPVYFGDINTGDLIGCVRLSPRLTESETVQIDDSLIAQLCACLDRSPVLRDWPLWEARKTSMTGWREEVVPPER